LSEQNTLAYYKKLHQKSFIVDGSEKPIKKRNNPLEGESLEQMS